MISKDTYSMKKLKLAMICISSRNIVRRRRQLRFRPLYRSAIIETLPSERFKSLNIVWIFQVPGQVSHPLFGTCGFRVFRIGDDL